MKDAIFSVIQILGFAILVGVFNILTNDQQGEKHTRYISKGVSYYKDSNGIPNIEADTLQDGFFALGFLHAEDRLWQMYLSSKLAKGELSELFGEKSLNFDKFARMLNLNHICDRTFSSFSQEEQTNLQAYTNGVNYYIDNTVLLPLEFLVLGASKFQWTIVDSCLSIKLIEYYLSTDFLKEIVREYLLNNNVISKDMLEKLFPYDINSMESKISIIKNNEAPILRKGQRKQDESKKEQKEEKKPEPKTTESKKEEIKRKNEEVIKKQEPQQFEAKPKKQRDGETEEISNKKMEEMIENTKKDQEKRKEAEHEKPNASGPRSSSAKQRAEAHHVSTEMPIKEKEAKTESDHSQNANVNANNERKTKRVTKSTTEELKPKKNDHDNKEDMEIPHTRQDIHGGSNSYVFSGKLTDDGQPILGNDPHLHNEMPAFWYVINMKIKSGRHYIGVTHPGSNTIFIGQNGFVAWGITIGFADISDFVKIPKAIVDSNYSFKLDNNKHKLIKRTETIYLNRKKTKSITEEFLDSEAGPVLNGYEDSLFAAVNFIKIPNLLDERYYYILRATFTNPYDSNFKAMTNFHAMNSLNEVHQRLSEISMSLSVVYADVTGNIGYQLTGKIPIRHKRAEGSFPAIIEHESDLIPKYIPFKELPHVLNPPKGYIVTCNNVVISEDYKYILQGGFIGDQRSRSIENTIEERLKQKKKITTQFVIEDIIGSVKDMICRDIISKIKKIASNEKSDVHILKDLNDFNCLMNGESTEALKYNVFSTELYNRLYYTKENITLHRNIAVISENKENYLLFKLDQYVSNPKLCITEYSQSCSKFLNEVYHQAIQFIKHRLGQPKNWKWKNLNQKYYPHMPFSQIPLLDILSSRLVKTDGNIHCPKTSGFDAFKKTYLNSLSSNLKYVTHLNKKNDFHISIDCGNNGRLFTKNYDHRCDLHERNELIHFDYSFSQNHTMKFLPE